MRNFAVPLNFRWHAKTATVGNPPGMANRVAASVEEGQRAESFLGRAPNNVDVGVAW